MSNMVKTFNKNVFSTRFYTLYNKMEKAGVIKHFDDEFYSQFNGMLYNVIPVEFYLRKMSMGRCYDASAVLGLAFGRSEETYVCRGNLKYAGLYINGTTKFGHGWVERDGIVYDTTWQISMPQEAYYKLFGVKNFEKRTTNKFFSDCEQLSDFHIHDKSYYENNYSNFAYPSLIQIRSSAEMLARNGRNEKQKEFGQKMLGMLPDMDKVYAKYKEEHDIISRELSENPAENCL